MTRRGLATPNCALPQVSVAWIAPADAVSEPASSALAAPGRAARAATARAAARPLRRCRTLVRRRRLGRLGSLGSLGGSLLGLRRLRALLGPRLVELDAPAALVLALLERQA